MKRKLYFLMAISIILTATLNAQVGINTENPQGIFHIDGKRNTNGNTNVSDDVVVDTEGRVGIGTNVPTNKLSIHTTGANTGLYLPNGAASGKVLTSDTQGNGVWVSGAVQYQTKVVGVGGAYNFNGLVPYPATDSPIGVGAKINFFTNVVFDRVKDIYGSAYGWDLANQHYIAPVSGIYRISMNMYFRSTQPGMNQRVYIFKNGNLFQDPGFISITDAGRDQNNFIMGLVSLNKGDAISFWVRAYDPYEPSANITLFGREGHTYILIESL
ncbi:hypothetical protein [Dysgonomonas sp. 520]|uniref:hypothetical protein n=1 Tax=Dysgonomonas sp. 520 TaxID=2302931 RepID=UPI0013D0A0B2|nr:hypothetical protein [Dysgonomonas sp. 520]NDW09431.1 hypothetical protein [Dysgonomonas sp. 520]